MVRKKDSVSFFLMNLLLLVNFIELTFPPITNYGNSAMIRLFCIVGWLGLSFITDIGFYLRSNIRMTYVLIFYAVTAVLPYMVNLGVIGNRYIALGMIPLGYLIFCYYKQHDRLRDLSRLLLITACFAAITLVRTLDALISNPYISRSIKSSGEHSASLAAQGIGGYSFIYMSVALCIPLLYIGLRNGKRYIRIAALIAYGLTFFLIVKSSYVTALVTVFAASLVLIVLNYAHRGGVRATITFMIVAAVAAVLLFNLTDIINSFADVLPERIARVLVVDSEESVYESLVTEFVDDRWPTMLYSIRSALKYPFFGLIASDAIDATGAFLSGFGQHSHVLDTYALYGLVIGTVNVFVMLRPFKDNNGKIIKRGRALNVAMLICMIGILFFNNATDSIAAIFGIVYPLVRETYHPEAQQDE